MQPVSQLEIDIVFSIIQFFRYGMVLLVRNDVVLGFEAKLQIERVKWIAVPFLDLIERHSCNTQ